MQHKIDDQTRAARVSQTAPTEAPTLVPVERSRKAWRSRGAAVGVITLALGLTACGGGSDSPEPAPAPVDVPAPVEVPAPAPQPPAPAPVPVDPTPVAAGFAKSGDILSAAAADVGDRYTKGTRVVVFDSVNNRYYELVTATAAVNYATAKQAAVDAGGKLASPSDAAKMTFVKQAYPAPDLPLAGDASGGNGAWIGLEQAAGGAAPGDNWAFLDGVALPAASTLWNAGEPNDGANPTETGAENFGAIFAGMTAAETDLRMIYDAGIAQSITQPKYLVEYLTKEAIKP